MSRSWLLAAVLLVFITGAVAPEAQAASLGKRVLKQGMRGHDVRVLQDFLTRLGVPTHVDGHFGPATASRVRSWERASNMRPNARMTKPDIRRMRRQLARGFRVQQTVRRERAAALKPVSRPASGDKARIGADGKAIAPASAPEAVKRIIAAGNRIHDLPYRYGGGHGSFSDSAYDCSGSVSYALRGAGLVNSPLASGGFFNWGASGEGEWVTIYTNAGHMYMVVAGLRFDTSGRARTGSRWQTEMRPTSGYIVRHPANL